jgi:hypothetical protein
MKNILESLLIIVLIGCASCSVASEDSITTYLRAYPLGEDPHPEQTAMVQKMSRVIAAKERAQEDIPGEPSTKGTLIGHIVKFICDGEHGFHQSIHNLIYLACAGLESARDRIVPGFAEGLYGLPRDDEAVRGLADGGSLAAQQIVLSRFLQFRDACALKESVGKEWPAAGAYMALFLQTTMNDAGETVLTSSAATEPLTLAGLRLGGNWNLRTTERLTLSAVNIGPGASSFDGAGELVLEGDIVSAGDLRLDGENIQIFGGANVNVAGAITIDGPINFAAGAGLGGMNPVAPMVQALREEFLNAAWVEESDVRARAQWPDINNVDFLRWFASKTTLDEKYELLTRLDLRFVWITVVGVLASR